MKSQYSCYDRFQSWRPRDPSCFIGENHLRFFCTHEYIYTSDHFWMLKGSSLSLVKVFLFIPASARAFHERLCTYIVSGISECQKFRRSVFV